MSTPLYDIYLGDKASLQGYRCRSFVRDSAPLVAPRFSTGVQGQTDLDLLKSASVDNLSGGMFQRTHLDTTKVARALGFYNAYEENLYPTVPPTAHSSGTIGSFSINAKAESESMSFYMTYQRSGGFTYNLLTKVVGTTVTTIALPAALTAVAADIKAGGMWLHKGYLYVSAGYDTFSVANCYRYDITAGTWQDIAGVLTHFFTVRGVLYGVNSTGGLYSCTNETAAGSAAYTQVATVGGRESVRYVAEFNGAGWLAKDDGLYRFDGLTVVKVLPIKATLLITWNGALWFINGKWLYKFDGSTVQKMQYFTETVYQLSSSSEYLFVQTWQGTVGFDSPKSLGGGTGFARVYGFNALGWYLLFEQSVTTESSIAHVLVYSSDIVQYFQPQFSGAAWDNMQAWRFNLASAYDATAVTSTSQLDITTSEDDAGFPNIYKSLEAIEVNYSGMINGDVITVKYQLYDGKTWGSWITAGTITFASTSPVLEITDYTNKLAKRVKINAYVSTMTAGSTIAMKGASWRYTLQPRARWRWNIGVTLAGNSTITDRAGTFISADSNALSSTLNQSIKQKTPLFLLAPDYAQLDTTVTNVATSFIFKGQLPIYTDPYNEYPLIAIKNNNAVWEILRVSSVSYNSGTDKTTVGVLERGYLGITAAAITAGAEFHPCYKIYITALKRDNLDLSDATYNEQTTTGVSQLQRDVVLEAVEV